MVLYNIHFLGLMTFILGILILCSFMLFCGYFLGGCSTVRDKNIPFESGISGIGYAKIRFSVKFYLIAVVFIIFDIEGIYLYTWAVAVRELGWTGFFEVFIFILFLLISLVYLIRVGVFNWVDRLTKKII